MKKIYFLLLSLAGTLLHAQNVGVGTANPAEKLDVNGNINVSGTLKANGVAGQNGQVLMSTGAGLTWGSLGGYKYSAILTATGAGVWTIPAGVTEIMVEAWGAGAGGTSLTGGSSGGYARTILQVAPGGSVSVNIGSGSTSGSTTTQAGGNTTASYGGITLTAFGGAGSTWSNNSLNIGYPGVPGAYSISPATTNLFGLRGKLGGGNMVHYQEYAPGNFSVITQYGYGGATVGLLSSFDNIGDMTELKAGTFTTGHYVANTTTPGGGGAGGSGSGYKGGDGMIVIWYN